MITLHRGEVRYSTKKPMTFAEALAFGKCLQCNPLFRDPFVECLPRPKDPIRAWRVVWKSASTETEAARFAAIQAEQDRRGAEQFEDYAIRLGTRPHTYDLHNHRKNTSYEGVYLDPAGRFDCPCEQHQLRMRGNALCCKHRAVLLIQLERGLVDGQSAVYGGRLAL